MKILLINPSQFAVYGSAASPAYPPLGLGYIGAVLEKEGHEVRILDIDADNITDEKLRKVLIEYAPDLLGLTSTTPTFKGSESIARMAKEHCIPVVLGGIHATVVPQECISSKYIDFVVKGEGEITIVELVDALEEGVRDFSQIKGVIYKKDNKPIFNKDRELIKDLDTLPFPARHLFNQQKYTYPDALSHPCMPIMTSRGCPGQCTYCCTKLIFTRRFRVRSAKNIVDEIEHLVNTYGVKEIHVWDDNFTLIKKRLFEIRDELNKRRLKLAFALPNGVRVDQIDKDRLIALKEMGVYSIAFGVESGNQQILNNVKKGINLTQIENAYKLAKSLELETWGFFMLGLPGDNDETIRDTINLAKTLDPDIAKFHILEPFPGTEVFDQFKEQGLITQTDYSKYGIHTRPVHKLPTLDEEDLLEWQKKAYREFYLRPSKIIRQVLRMKSYTRLRLNFNAGVSILKMMR